MNYEIVWSSSDRKFHAYEKINGQLGKELCYEGGPAYLSGIYSYDLVKRNNQCYACQYVWIGYRAFEQTLGIFNYP